MRYSTPLSMEDINRLAPSALAIAPHHSRSDRYQFVSTRDVIEGMAKAGFLPFMASQSGTRIEDKRGFTKHMLRFRSLELAHKAAVVGDVVPELVLVNGHDGSSLYKLMGGIFRFICSNGAIVADSLIGSISVRHTGNVVAEVVEASATIIGQTQKALGVVNQWKGLMLTDGEQNAFAHAAHHLRFADSEGKVNTPITAAQLLQIRRPEDTGKDLWSTFNRVQENTIRGGLTAQRRTDSGSLYENGRRIPRTTTRAVTGIDQDVKLNKALWTLAERMAELKNGSAQQYDGIIDAQVVDEV